jgi:signal transduction histidine kinase
MSREASGISPDELRTRLTVRNDRDEVGRLGVIINSLLDRLSSSLEQQRRFVADASHELRTPLAILRGEAEVALAHNDRPAEDYRTSLGILHDESIHMAKIVDDLFTLARADAGQIQFHAKSLYLEEIVEEAVRSIRVLAAKKDITIECALEHCVPYEGDESLLRRLFLNLLDNAVKYSRPHSTVIVSGKLSVDKRVYLVNIADSGPGIPESDREKIFERFYRVDKARTREDGAVTSGSGLGLSIANWIADVHNAEISLTSSSESGSIFAVSFPILS